MKFPFFGVTYFLHGPLSQVATIYENLRLRGSKMELLIKTCTCTFTQLHFFKFNARRYLLRILEKQIVRFLSNLVGDDHSE